MRGWKPSREKTNRYENDGDLLGGHLLEMVDYNRSLGVPRQLFIELGFGFAFADSQDFRIGLLF